MKVGDKVKFKRFGKFETGNIIEIVDSDIWSIKVKPDNKSSYRQRIALKESSITIIE